MVILFIFFSQVRDECSVEWSEMFTEMNEKWERTYRETKEGYLYIYKDSFFLKIGLKYIQTTTTASRPCCHCNKSCH